MINALLLAACLSGATATVSDTITVAVPPDRLAAWLVANPAALVRASRCELLRRIGAKMLIRKRTPKGVFTFEVEEKLSHTADRYVYTCLLVSTEGEMQDYRLVARLNPQGTGSLISIHASATVNSRRIHDTEVRRSMEESLIGVRKLLGGLR